MAEPRIVFLTQWWPTVPQDSVIVATADSLRRVGRVVVVTGPPLDLRSNEIMDGRFWIRHELTRTGPFPVIRHSFYPGHTASSLERIAMYTTFAASSMRSVGSVFRGADVCVVYGSPMTANAAGWVARRLRGTPYVCIVQDVWPDAIFVSGMVPEGAVAGMILKTMNAVVQRFYRDASHIVVISHGMKQLLMDRGVPEDKLTVLFNWGDEHLYAQPVPVPPRLPGEPLHVMYAGNFGAPQGLDDVLRAFALLPPDLFRLTLVGGGAEDKSLRALADESDLGNVTFAGSRRGDEMPAALATAHLHLVSLRDESVFAVTVPHKVQSLMLAGLPIIGAVAGEAARIIEAAGAGWVTQPSNPQALAAALKDIEQVDGSELVKRGRAGRDYYLAEMSQAKAQERMQGVILEVTEASAEITSGQ